MRVFRNVDELPAFNRAILTIGTFDGVHKGHQTIIKRIRELAKQNNGESIILTFHPHPRLVINPNDHTLKLLNTLDEKISLLEKYGIDNLIIVPFSDVFRNLSANDYIEKFLWDKIKPHTICIGYDHHFGKGRTGNISLIREFAATLGFKVEEITKQEVDHITVSSTEIRKDLTAGNIELANDLLGHYFSLSGTIVEGRHLGTKIGFPTANIQVGNPNKLIPAEGIYAVMVLVKGIYFQGMLYIGTSPTVDGSKQTIEVNIFDFDEDIYNETITIMFVASIRKDEKFSTIDDLVEQLHRDKVMAQKLLA